MIDSKKKRILSGIQPTGIFTIGNYIGALQNWVQLQDEYECIYMIVDLHSLTIKNDPKKLREMMLSSYALLLSCGIDTEKSLLFMQSNVIGHAELAWILSCYTQFGELSRMTQFKEKSISNSENINSGLFTYPVLQTADILLYNADIVPVGIDQKQHIELARNIAVRFNGIYGDVFTIPEPYIKEYGSKIMSLSDPVKKMSKSDSNINGYISLLDTPDVIIKKFKKSITDSESVIEFREGKAGINNLMTIYSSITSKNYTEIQNEFEGKGYGDFKLAVAEAVVEFLRPIQDKYQKLICDKSYIEAEYKKCADKANTISIRTLDKVYKKIGIVR